MRRLVPLLLVAAFALAGCGGGSGTTNRVGQIAGNVTDANGDPVRDALVRTGSRQAFTNPSGAFLLDEVPEGQVVVRAEITQDGVRFSGQNVAQVFAGERTKSVNLAVVRDSLQAAVRGAVTTRAGDRVKGAKVFAIGGGLSSAMAITDSDGRYRLDGLQSGIEYYIIASAPTFASDDAFATLTAGEVRTLNWVLGNGGDPLLPPPTMREAVSWTTPPSATRQPNKQAAFEAIKNLIRPDRAYARRARSDSRVMPDVFHEIDLYWAYVDSLNLLGYGVYRSGAAAGPFTAVDYLRDPLAEFYADFSDELRAGSRYYYRLTSLNTQYPDSRNGESDPSSVLSGRLLGELVLRSPDTGPLSFRWQPAQGAETYKVYVFNRYPGVGVTPFWVSSPTTSNSLAYAGPSLEFGKAYYYIVLGQADGGAANTLSDVDMFVNGG
ncbi:MAG: carboxypeptidase regulatory-like domain-containing protein [Fimbriimonadaceae bacterium]|nr:carboxypeptidase regulatory-like domain-containing protein [Fimbriimonadaceae bacterium]